MIGSLTTTAGVAQADDYPEVVARLHFNINLTDSGNTTCPQTSTQYANLEAGSTDSTQWAMGPNPWKADCGAATSRVRSSAQRLADGRVRIRINLAAIKEGVTWVQKDATIMVNIDGSVQSTDISLESSDKATAFGHFAASAKAEPRQDNWQKYSNELTKDDVNSDIEVTVHRSGHTILTGHLHNEGFTAKNVKVTCALRVSEEKVFTFEADGDTRGTLAAVEGNKSYDWYARADDYRIKNAFSIGQITPDTPFDCVLSVKVDSSSDVAGGVLITLKILSGVIGFL